MVARISQRPEFPLALKRVRIPGQNLQEVPVLAPEDGKGLGRQIHEVYLLIADAIHDQQLLN